MRIVGASGPAVGHPAITRRGASEQRPAETPQARALIAVEAPAPSERMIAASRYPAAPFLAQLIATQMQAPQTRARRRAEPEDAIAVYAAMTAPRPLARGRSFGKRA